ncbi:acyltransferase family protein [Streptococcus suis]|uniref:acyltransferase family protein n=1 Tax=Streptococcus suis TaxID=1307 RepID=UPI000CF6ECFD|nr:acyltransferase family protein [Streptococcus suis]
MKIKWLSLIRVIGLVFVLLYHFFIKNFPGGFVGVDLFFTLSGYLTTALLIDEFSKNKKIDIIGFFKRRFYRILPPLVLTILLILPLTLLIRNDFRANIGSQVAATLGFMTNFFEILAGGSYENQFAPHLFVHTWTLAIEVQYYLLWAGYVWFMARISKSIGQLRGTIFLTSTGLFTLSFLAMFLSSFFTDNFSSIYYSSFTHTFPFFLGGMLATIAGVSNTTPQFHNLVEKLSFFKTLGIFVGGLVVEIILLFTLQFSSIWTYLVGLLLSSLATAAMVFSARILHEKTESIKEPQIILFLANISYGIYLFHWPLVTIFTQLTNGTIAAALSFIFSVILATISFYIFEPFVAGKVGQLFGLPIDLKPYKKWIEISLSSLAILGLGICLFAPKLGSFEHENMISSIYQAQTQMNTTRSAAENVKATGFEIQKGITIFGDSVTVRASSAIQETLPDAQIDGTVSRNLTEISKLITLYKQNNTLKETVVVALGTNAADNYQELLDQLVNDFPKGHRLIFVTPYDGNYTPSNSIAYKTGQYEQDLAEKYDYISIADWYQVAKDNPTIWLNTDLVHFNLETNGADLFAQTIKNAIDTAANGPVKN